MRQKDYLTQYFVVRLRCVIDVLLLALVLTSCGGGGDGGGGKVDSDDDDGKTTVTVSGVVQKGLFDTLLVTAFPVDPVTSQKGEPTSTTINGQQFTVEMPQNSLLLFEATGTFINDVTGELTVLDQPLKILLDTAVADLNANINFLTTIVAERALQELPASNLAPKQLIEQQIEFVNSVFAFPPGTDPSLLDFRNITKTSDFTDPDLQLLILSGGISGLIETGTPPNSVNDGLVVDGTPFDDTLENVVDNIFPSNGALPGSIITDQGLLFGGAFGDIVDNILAAESVPEAVSGLGALNGLAAAPVYQQVQENSGLALPNLSFEGSPALLCNTAVACEWQLLPAGSTVSVSGASVWEAAGKATVTVRLSLASLDPVSVLVRTESDSAIMGEDFVGFSKEIEIPAGDISASIDFGIIIDALDENTENISVILESLTPAYAVLAEQTSIAIKDGAPASLEGQNATGMQILSVSIPSICNPVVNMDGGDCTSITGQGSQLALVEGRITIGLTEIDLATDCPTGAGCQQQNTDWLVNFFLIAKDNLGVAQGEVPLGPYIYKQNSVQLIGKDARLRYPFLRLSNAAVTNLARDSFVNNWGLEIEARIGAQPQVSLPSALPPVLLLPDSVQVGESILQLGAISSVELASNNNCQLGQYAIDAQYYYTSLPLVSGVLCVDFDPLNTTGGTAVMVEGRLDIVGGTAGPTATTALALPDGLATRMTFGGDTSSGLPLLILAPSFIDTELYREGWPFTFELNTAALTPQGIELGYNNMQYIMDVGYSSSDPRSVGQLYSNDIYYRGVAGQSGTLILGPDGINATFSVTGGSALSAYTAFPKAQIEWQTFNQVIDRNVLQPTTIAIDRFIMSQSTSCRGPGCDVAQADVYGVSAAATLDGYGYMLGNAVNQRNDQVPGWGKRADGSLAWSRPDDLTAQQNMKLAVPGYIMPATMRVSDYLVAHLNEASAGSNLSVYPLGTAEFIDGNYHPTGLSVGPEKYRNAASGTPETGDGQNLAVTGSRLRVFNGSDPAFDLASSVAVKYVIRNAGITGVFNVSSASLGLSGEAKFYGYPLNLSRFAVRATDNELDTYNWIDGSLALKEDAGGPAGELEIWFNNLEINCSARLGNVDLIYEACDTQDNNGNGITDENCAPRLYAWKAETDIFSAGFKGGSAAQACAVTPQLFSLQHQMYFTALNKPVAFETEWRTDGRLKTQTGGQLPTYRFDRSAEGKGFPVNTAGVDLEAMQVDGDRYGWLAFKDTTVGVPFWNALNVDLRIANALQFGEIVAEPTVVLPGGKLGGLEAAQSNKSLVQAAIEKGANDKAFDTRAQYEWGRTGFGFQLPVYYQPWQLDAGRNDEDAQGRQSRFVGRALSKDLFVLKANAGINFIEPERTKLSFGASADFEKLGNLSFQIDITDPGSAAAVDDVLMKFKVTNRPLLEPALTDFLDTINIVNRYANRGLDELMQAGIERALLETPNGQDPFVTVSELLTQVKSVPQQVTAIVSDELRAPLDRQLFSLEQQLRGQLLKLESALTGLPPAPSSNQIGVVFTELGKLEDLLDLAIKEAGDVENRVDDAVGRALGLRDQAAGYLDDLDQAIDDIDQVMQLAVTFEASVCSAQFDIDDSGANGFLNDVAVRFAAVRKVADIIRGSGQIFDAVETLANDADARRRLNTAQRRISEASRELLDFVDAADLAVRGAVCQPENIADVVSNARKLTDQIRGDIGKIRVAFADATSPLVELDKLKDSLADGVIQPAQNLLQALSLARREIEDAVATVESIDGARLVWNIDCALFKATTANNLSCPNPTGAMPNITGLGVYAINALAASGVDERDIADLLFTAVQKEISDTFDKAEAAILANTANLLPGAYFSPEQLRRLLATEIMRSVPIKELRLAMDKHFGEIGRTMNGIVLQFTDQVNFVIETALASVTGPINDALKEALAGVRGIPLQAAGINGYATIAGNELERAHISAGWTMRGSDDGDSTGFKAALDAESWSARNKTDDGELNTATACAAADAGSLLDVKISAYGLPIKVLAADIDIEKLYLGFTLKQNEGSGPALIPIGVFGGINTMGEIGFSEAIIFDPAFAAGIGKLQTYIGASAGAQFSSMTAEVAFLVGRVCPGNTALSDLDPDAAKFLPSLPASGFTGAYLRGGATIPIIPGGCFLSVGVTADFGTWIFVGTPTNIGGLVGGGAVGQVACIASIRGQVRVGGNVSSVGDLKLTGEAWGVAGLGSCEPGTWTSVRRSREDKWCGTGDVQFDASFDNGKWKFTPPTPSAVH